MAPGEPDTGPAGFKTIPGIFCGNGFLKKGHVELLESWKSVDKKDLSKGNSVKGWDGKFGLFFVAK